MNRRQFFRQSAFAAGAGMTGRILAGSSTSVTIVVDPSDPITRSAPVTWAVGELKKALIGRGLSAEVRSAASPEGPAGPCILVAGTGAASAKALLGAAGASLPERPESLAVVPGKLASREVLLATGRGSRGFVYALLELADAVAHDADPLAVLRPARAAVESPANRIRCISRAFCTDLEDKPWFNDREMWPEYFRMLLTNRFNRFNLTLGLAYDFMRNVTDCYFHFAYPFLVDVPGYNVRAVGLPDSERDNNLDMLRHISDTAAARGLQFQLGVWDHAYEWADSPKANYTHTGLNASNHGPYCRDALRLILQKCPGITGVTIRIHGESGVAEGNYDFWKTIFDGVATCGRKVEIDLHAKGIDDKMIDNAVATGMPVVVAPKYWAEHMGLPYHQAAIRELERAPRENRGNLGLFGLSNGERRFTRYGYADLVKEKRRYGIVYRMFPGGRRVLMWGDPLTAAGYGRVSSFCGTDGVDFMEPLYFKGRRGSGVPGGRCSYADASLNPRWDWQKFEYTMRIWGRHLYNPDVDPAVWRRYARKHFGPAARRAEDALANATRVLQVVCTAHGVSGAHNRYWPEMYTNQSIVEPDNTYGDTPAPKRFGTVSPFDPELFLTIDETADEMLAGKHSGKYAQTEVALWLESYSGAALRHLEAAEKEAAAAGTLEFRRLAVDTRIQAGLGRFFAAKIRSAVLWRLYDRSGERKIGEEALRQYRAARDAWFELSRVAAPVYLPDVSYGPEPFLRGHWKDRLPAIEQDIARMAAALEQPSTSPKTDGDALRALARPGEAPRPLLPPRLVLSCRHVPPERFVPASPLAIKLEVPPAAGPVQVGLRYRHVNQAETYRQIELRREGTGFIGEIPASYTDSPYPLQYYFVIRDDSGKAGMFPGFNPDLANQPYFAIRQG